MGLLESRAKIKIRDAKRETSFDGGSSKDRLDIQDKTTFKKRSSNQVPIKCSKDRDDRVSNPKPQKGRGTSSPTKKITCGKCGKQHYDHCLKGKNNYFCYGKSGHKVQYLPYVKGQDKKSWQASVSNDARTKNRFYALHSRGNKRLLPMW